MNWHNVPSGIDWDEVAGTAVDKDNNIIVFARGKTSVVVLNSSGQYINSFGKGEFLRPHSIRIDSENYYWFVDDGDHTVKKYNSDKLRPSK